MKKLTALVFGAAVALAACGGSSEDTSPPTSQVPDSASASVGGFIAYLQALVASSADMFEPVDISAVMPPRDETSAPQVID